MNTYAILPSASYMYWSAERNPKTPASLTVFPSSSIYLVAFATGISSDGTTLGTPLESVIPRKITLLLTGLNTSTPSSSVLYLIVCVTILYSPYLPFTQGITAASAGSASGSLASGFTISAFSDFQELIYSIAFCPVKVRSPK